MRTSEELEVRIDTLLQPQTMERALRLGGEEFGTTLLVYVNALRWALNSSYLPNHIKIGGVAPAIDFSKELVDFLLSQLGV